MLPTGAANWTPIEITRAVFVSGPQLDQWTLRRAFAHDLKAWTVCLVKFLPVNCRRMVITCVFTTAGGRVDHHVCDARKDHMHQQRRGIYANGVDDHAGCAPAHITTAGGVGGHQAIDARADAGGVDGHHVLDDLRKVSVTELPATR